MRRLANLVMDITFDLAADALYLLIRKASGTEEREHDK